MKNVKDCSSMFSHCDKLENIVCDKGLFESPIDLSWMFYECNNLINIPGGLFWYSIDWSNVNDVSRMFEGCNKLSDFSIGWALYLMNSINIQKIPAASRNLSQSNSHSPFYASKINVNNRDFLEELAMNGTTFDYEMWMSLINAGWNGIANFS